MTPRLRRWAFFCFTSAVAVFTTFHLLDILDLDSSLLFPDSQSSNDPYINKGFNWKDVPQRYPVTSVMPLPTGPAQPIPRIQYEFPAEKAAHKTERLARLEAVKKSFEHSWNGYRSYAWLQDEIMPLSGGSKNDFGGWGATLVDNLDTLCIMGMKKEFNFAVKALKKIDFRRTELSTLNVFETTIRYLGGLLSAYDLCGNKHPILLHKAVELGDMLYAAFDTPNRMPVTRWDWRNGMEQGYQEAPKRALAAEVGSLTLEFTRLSQLTGDSKYYDAVQRVTNTLEQLQNDTKMPGLFPVNLNVQAPGFSTERVFTFGGMVDSLYEYFPKQHILLGGRSEQYRKLYERAIEVAKKHMFFRPLNPGNKDILLSGTIKKTTRDYTKLNPEAQHLACFTGGMVGLAAKIFDRAQDLSVARKLVEGCIWAYESMPTGIMPEIFTASPCRDEEDCKWSEARWMRAISETGFVLAADHTPEAYVERNKLSPGFTSIADGRYSLRPEAIESVFILYRITGDSTLQDRAWAMFQAVEKATKTDISYASLVDVRDSKPHHLDSCESFWMAETLKYFYLMFSEPGVISLDDYVFNTEAHPFRRSS